MVLILRNALILRGVFILTTLVLTLTLTAACGGGNGSLTETPSIVTTVVISDRHDGSLTLANRQINLGDVNTVAGEKWVGVGSVDVFLLTAQQFREGGISSWSVEAVLLGEATPTEEGSFSFDFRVESSYQASDGSQLVVLAGDELFVGAIQKTKTGGSGRGVGPMVIGLEEGG